MQRNILHVDVNNAFLSWTAIDKLKKGEKVDIRTIPAIIGGDEEQRKGVVLAKSNLAKQFGIQTGEPIFFARKKCPQLQVYRSNFEVYNYYSNAMYQLFLEYTDKIEPFSIDECFLDLTESIVEGKNIMKIASEIRNKIKEKLEFTVNIGVAHNKLLAKMASDFEKPDKIHTLYEEEIKDKMWKLPVSELFMVGRKSLLKLQKLGIKTIEDLANKKQEELIQIFGKYGKTIWEYANGIDTSPVKYEIQKTKGIGKSITLPYDYNNIEKLEEILLSLTEQVTYQLRQEKMKAQVVNVQIKTKDFQIYSHQKKLEEATNSTKRIYIEAKRLIRELEEHIPVRLIGIRIDNLIEEKQKQLSFFETNDNEKQEKIDEVLDSLKQKYGYNKIIRAREMKIQEKINQKI